MTRLFYGSTLLAGLCAMTLIVGCGGSSGPTVTTCDGGNCGDAKRDGVKLDVPPKLDGVQLDTPKLDGPAANLDGPPPKLDVPPANLDVPPANLDVPPANLDVPPANLDVPPANLDVPPANLDVPPANLDVPPANLDVPPANLDVRPSDVTIPNPDVRPSDTIIPPPADAADAAADSQPVIHDAGSDGIVAIHDAAGDGGTDGIVAVIDTAPDGPAVIVDADAAAEAGPDGTVVVAGDAADGSVADAPEIDAPVVEGGANDGPSCEGDVCHAYTFEGNNLDGGPSLPTGFTAVGPGTWDLVLDGSNIVLQGTGGASSFAEATLPPATTTDETIEVKVRFMNADPNNVVRICGRFTTANDNAYCLEISLVPGDAGTTPGSMTIVQRNNVGGLSDATNATAANLPITVGTWHTYRFSIASSPGPAVVLEGYLDGATTPTVSGADATAIYTAGAVALGVRNVTAQFDNLITTP